MNFGDIRSWTTAQILLSNDNGPIRAELFGVERLEQHAETLAVAQRVLDRPEKGYVLASRLADNRKALSHAFQQIVSAAQAHHSIPPAAEWILDNYHIVDEQIREIREDLPSGYYRKLPKLADGPLKGYPRVFGISWAIVAHTDSAFDITKLTRFAEAYQRVQPLTIGELWALAITLRITLVENLRRITDEITLRLSASWNADDLADRFFGAASSEPISALVKSLGQAPWSPAFAVQLAQRLRDRDPNVTPALRWINDRLAADGMTVDQIVRDELQRQSAANVTVRNIITSMRLISSTNWRDFFESVSLVDEVMREADGFTNLDFPTRDLYRRSIEVLANNSGVDEVEVARRVVERSTHAAMRKDEADYGARRERDPGFYLIAEGRPSFEADLNFSVPLKSKIFRLLSRTGVTSYAFMVVVLAAIILFLGLLGIGHAGVVGWMLAVLAVAGFIPVSDMATSVINRLITHQVGAMQLPSLELRQGIPDELRTMIVMPILLTSEATINEYVERLEVHFLANPDDNFSFALLSDWTDAAMEHCTGDDELIAAAAAGIASLNKRHGSSKKGNRFLLFHRRRVWNTGEGLWMGWERKRGKLHELNRLLRGASDTSYIAVDGRPPQVPSGVRYVITLDADTRLPIGTGKQLVGKIAHPLNRAWFDVHAGYVVAGHGILQPRVTPSLPMGAEGSLFQRLFSGPSGVDPYAIVVSDVYQDLYGEGSYCGKGIYDIDAFEASLEARIPHSSVLSHDLLEGIFARSALVSDIEFVEEFPSRYDVAAARQHRWVRGDWQLLPWIFFGGSAKSKRRTPIPLSGRWKLADNLRRSLSAPSALLSLVVGWWLPLQPALIWSGFNILIITFPTLLAAAIAAVPRRRDISKRNHWRGIGHDISVGLTQSAFVLTFMAHQAWLTVDAIARTLFRLFVSRRHLLEWVTTAQATASAESNWHQIAMQVVASCSVAGTTILIVASGGNDSWLVATPFCLLWAVFPLAAWWTSMPPALAGHLPISPHESASLRLAARRTWGYFEQFVTEDDNFLPPDNFQEEPHPVVAHRTSPTNIGLYLLSVVAARDFGWIGTIDALERLENTFHTLEKMEHHRGHLFNWYNTNDLSALEPKYISTVDSGNLAGLLVALANACREFPASPLLHSRWKNGVEDALDLLRERVDLAFGEQKSGDARYKPICGFVDSLTASIQRNTHGLKDAAELLCDLEDGISALRVAIRQKTGSAGTSLSDVSKLGDWIDELSRTVLSHKRDIEFLAPWAIREEIFFPSSYREDDLPTISDLCARKFALQKAVPFEGSPSTLNSESTLNEAALELSHKAAAELSNRSANLANRASTACTAMEFNFLLDTSRQLFSIGYRASDNSLDSNVYDLLASEARLASFVAIAKGDVPAKHWFQLGRTLTRVPGGAALISWSGSMFEYLMPSLVMRAPAGSLLAETNKLAVRCQEAYGDKLGVPWGMSESAYNARDIERTYQYSSFGVPALGYKRGLSENIVVAPYASALATMVDPTRSIRNLQRLANDGASGSYGWFEALDFTRSRLPEGARFVIVRCYMAHHQAMSLLAIANSVHDGDMRARFHAEPMVQAAELLLQERMPRDVAIARRPKELVTATTVAEAIIPETQRRFTSAYSRIPRTNLLSNGRLSTMVTAAGSGYIQWNDIAVTRWREDVTCDNWGSYFFIRDVQSRYVWSAGYQPTIAKPDRYAASFTEDRAEIVLREGSISTKFEVTISPEDDAEVRRISLTNHGTRSREIELTSYVELSLARQSDDMAHPAFAKLFVQTEFVPQFGALLATRRTRSDKDPCIWVAHFSIVDETGFEDIQFETDRAQFVGRGQDIHNPAAMSESWPLSNTVGAVLDPIFSIRRRVAIARGETVQISFWTVVAETRDQVLELVEKHRDAAACERAMTLAWTQAQMQLHHLGLSVNEAHLYQRLANHILFANDTLRPAPEVLRRGAKKASILWVHGISGDLPIILVRVESDDDLVLARQVLRAHEYWKLKQLAVDLVVLNERATSYVQDFQSSLDALVRIVQSMIRISRPEVRGNIFVLRGDLISSDVRESLLASARVVLHGQRGSLSDQLNISRERGTNISPESRKVQITATPNALPSRPPMEFSNGCGGFVADGREYLIVLEGDKHTPAPWINVISNPSFGFQVSADGGGYTWSVNSQQNQLTPWSNDSTTDMPCEVIYIRDEDTGILWTPTARPIRHYNVRYLAYHGQGYSRFEQAFNGIALSLVQYVPLSDSIKISRLKITNLSPRLRNISVTAYVEWLLGSSQRSSKPMIITDIDGETGALLAQNPWSNDFGERVAFLDMGDRQTSWTGDRMEFVGRNGTLKRPTALYRDGPLSNRVGPALDACGAVKTLISLAPAESLEIDIFLGQCGSRREISDLLQKYRRANLDEVLNEVKQTWTGILETVQVKTPDRALDILTNHWLLYQALSCRVWARTAFYQSSGAFGFRDQLQDVMALCVTRPDIAREHLLRAASRQFPEGDVQHWWLPENGRGLRTRVSDDRIWLAFVAAHYIKTTGDTALMDELIPFLDGPHLQDDERDHFFEPTTSISSATFFDHCALALESSLMVGSHGLPLIGAGDWNDGMDHVGDHGRGESVWLGWFVYSALTSFAKLAEERGDTNRSREWAQHSIALKQSLEREAWDGDWYRRAYFDDGTPLGSVTNSNCRIDSIAQSWAVISRAADQTRATRAMSAVDKYLIHRDQKLALLFAPPFDSPAKDPGYIKGYPPGIRENGGQYTHAGTWVVQAYAMLGDGDKTYEILSMLNPIYHSNSSAKMHRFKVEPYVVPADIYSVPPHVGRGGWTWYTGSAAWMYRVTIERLLGFRLQNNYLLIDPCIPHDWPGFLISYRHHSTQYDISVENPLGVCHGVLAAKVDGNTISGDQKNLIPLVDDGATHRVVVVLG